MKTHKSNCGYMPRLSLKEAVGEECSRLSVSFDSSRGLVLKGQGSAPLWTEVMMYVDGLGEVMALRTDGSLEKWTWNRRILKVSKSLTRTLSLPRKCRICGKMVYFRSIRCRVCNCVSHRQCLDHIEQGSNPNNPLVRQEVHQPEPDQNSPHQCIANRTKATVAARERLNRRESIPADSAVQRFCRDSCVHHWHATGLKPLDSPLRKRCEFFGVAPPSPRSVDGGTNSGFYRRLVCWLKNRKAQQERTTGPSDDHALCEKYMKGRYGLKSTESQTTTAARKKLRLALAGTGGPTVANKGWPTLKRDPQSQATTDPNGTSQSPRFLCSGATYIHRDSGISSSSSSVAQTPSWDCELRGVNDHPPTSTAPPTAFCRNRCILQKPSRDPLPGSQPSQHPVRLGLVRSRPACYPVHATVPTGSYSGGLVRDRTQANVAHTVHLFCGQLDEGCFGRRCPSKTRTLSLESRNDPREDLCATWPPIGRKIFTSTDDAFEGSESGFEDYDADDDSNSLGLQSQSTVKDALVEWSIPFKDLKIERQVRRGRRHDIYRGRWHGEVMIHIFHTSCEQETTQFWKEVTSLSMIRHENVALFMGVCIDMPQLAIITSVRKGSSLFDHIHVKRDHFPLPYKVQIARQVAQGMSYLHAKGIIHRKLNSKNILLETKVKVCLLDQGMAEKALDRVDYGCVPKGHLTYVSPEIMQSLKIEPPRIVPTLPFTKDSDVFAFGTLLYELFGEQWPFQGQRAHSIIWQVASGHLQSLEDLKCSSGIKTLISECWSTESSCRPTFHHILRILQQNVLLHRRHSTSEPDNLNRLGFGQGLLPC